MAIPKYVSAEEYSRQSGLGVEEVKRLCRIGELAHKRTEKGYYKVIVYDDAVPKDMYDAVVRENTELKTILNTIALTVKQVI